MRLLLLSVAYATSHAFMHGWRDQFVRISPQLVDGLKAARRRLAPGTDFDPKVKDQARAALEAAEKIAHAARHGDKRGRKMMASTVTTNEANREATINGVTIPDMSLFDCPWGKSLYPYQDFTPPTYSDGTDPLKPPPKYLVDGGLCLPYQEIAFPFESTRMEGAATWAAGAPRSAAGPTPTHNIVCPGPHWNPDKAMCFSDATETTQVICVYPNETTPTGIAENYGCAAANPGWPSSDPKALLTPVCKTYVDDCTYSKKPTRKYQYAPGSAIDPTKQGTANEGYDINWVLHEVGKIRNALGLNTFFATDPTLGYGLGSSWKFPEGVYEALYGKPAGTAPPTEGYYPHAYTKGLFTSAGVIDTDQDGTCGVGDAAPQWMDCGIPCPVGDEARMQPGDMKGYQAVVLIFMFLCAVVGAAAFFFVGKDTSKYFVGGRNLNLFVVTATLASQSLDGNAALGNVDLGYKYHCAALPRRNTHPPRPVPHSPAPTADPCPGERTHAHGHIHGHIHGHGHVTGTRTTFTCTCTCTCACAAVGACGSRMACWLMVLSVCCPPPLPAGWDGACLPIGLGLSLILNGIFFAKPLNNMKLLTLPDVFARKFGPATEVGALSRLPLHQRHATMCTRPPPTPSFF